MKPFVCFVILNWNGWEDTIKCIDSLRNITYPKYHIILIDNGSTDGSVEKITPHLDARITLVVNDINLGFAKGSNQGIEHAMKELNPEFIFLFNNDITVEPNFLDKMIDKTKDPKVGMVQGLMLLASDPTIIDSTGHTIQWGWVRDRGAGEKNSGQYKDAKNLIGASGAANLIRVDMIKQIGNLDESYVTGFEDSEYSWRGWKCGWKTEFAPEAIIYHKRSASINQMIRRNSEFVKMLYSNSPRPCKQHGTVIQKIQFLVTTGIMAITSCIRYLMGWNTIGGGVYIIAIKGMFSNDS